MKKSFNENRLTQTSKNHILEKNGELKIGSSKRQAHRSLGYEQIQLINQNN